MGGSSGGGREGEKEADKDRRYRDKEFLEREYWENGKTVYDIADMCDVCEGTISKWMHKLGVPIRDRKQVNPLKNGLKPYTKHVLYFLAELAMDGRRHVSSRETRDLVSSTGKRIFAFNQLHRLGVVHGDNIHNSKWIIDKQKILQHVPVCSSCNRILTRNIHKLNNPKYTEQYKDKDICTDCWIENNREEISRIREEAAAAAF